MTTVLFDRVAIVGVGLLGASLGLALRQRRLAKHVIGVGREGSRSLEVALARKAIDETSTDPAEAVASADLVVLCTPIRQFPETMRVIAPALKPGALVTDVGSTKDEVLRWAEEFLPAECFVGSHPMAGSEKSGPEAAREDLYDRAVCLVCPGAAPRASVERIAGLWKAVGMRIIEIDSGLEHDRWVATISHMPHAVAYALVNAAAREPEMLQAVAGGFVDTTRVASSDTTMWRDIFLTNRDATLDAIDIFTDELANLRDAIETADEAAISTFLDKAKQTRDALMSKRAKRPATGSE